MLACDHARPSVHIRKYPCGCVAMYCVVLWYCGTVVLCTVVLWYCVTATMSTADDVPVMEYANMMPTANAA